MQLLNDRVLIKPIVQDVTKGGIILPQNRTSRDPTEHGVVMSVGPGRMLDNGQRVQMQLEEGDHVVIPYQHTGAKIEIERVSYRILKETDILAKIE